MKKTSKKTTRAVGERLEYSMGNPELIRKLNQLLDNYEKSGSKDKILIVEPGVLSDSESSIGLDLLQKERFDFGILETTQEDLEEAKKMRVKEKRKQANEQARERARKTAKEGPPTIKAKVQQKLKKLVRQYKEEGKTDRVIHYKKDLFNTEELEIVKGIAKDLTFIEKGDEDMLKITENPIEKNGKKKNSNPDNTESVQAVNSSDVVSQKLTEIMERQDKKDGLAPITQDEAQLIYDVEKQGQTYDKSTEYIKENINTVMKVAEHLYYVCNYKLYRFHYNSIKEYAEAEFNYTKGRFFQLTRAHEIAEYINSAMKKQVLTTEPQCRELLKLKVYKDFENEDEEATKKKRLEVIKEILKNNSEVATGLIAKEVAKAMEKVNDKRAEDKPLDNYNSELQSSVGGIRTKMANIFSAKKWSDKEKSEIKNTAIKELATLLAELKSKEV